MKASSGEPETAPSICLCSPHYPPVVSGVGDYTYFLAAALAELGCTVEVLTSVGKEDPTLYPNHAGVEVHRVVESWELRGLPKVLETVQRLRSDTLFLQYVPHAYDRRGLTLGVNLLPGLVRSRLRKRVVVNFHELFFSFDGSLRRRLAGIWQRGMAFLTASTSTRITVNSSEWPRRLRRIGVLKAMETIPVGSNIPRASAHSDDIRQIRSSFMRDGESILVGCFGSAGEHRDLDLLVESLKRMRGSGIQVRVVWLGNSGVVTRTTGDAPIVWTGVLPHPQISRIMSACDIFVLPFTDGVSTKRGTLAAALLHGVPVIATRGQRVDPMFVHRSNIFLVPVGDSERLAQALVEMAESPELRGRLSEGALRLHELEFAWNVIGNRVLKAVFG